MFKGRRSMRIVFKLRELLVATKLRWSGRIVLNHTSEMTMRMMLKFTLPVEKGNQAIKDGSLGKTLESIMKKLKPEAAYFAPVDGKRGGMIFFDLAEPSQIAEVVEPLILNLNAATEIVPVMNADDLRKGLAKAAK